MPKSQLHLLSAVQVDRIKPTTKDQMYNDGGGLYLFSRHYGSKEWIFRYTSPLTKKRRKQSLGTYPDTTIKEAHFQQIPNAGWWAITNMAGVSIPYLILKAAVMRKPSNSALKKSPRSIRPYGPARCWKMYVVIRHATN